MTLIKGLEELNIFFDDHMLDQIEIFYDMLIEKNKVINLTRITDKNDFYVKHILDSLLVAKVIDVSKMNIIDIGTGAGFPGIPLKIFFPDTRILLLDSLNKRLTFLNEVIMSLSLRDLQDFGSHGLKTLRRFEDLSLNI